jgi:hypothetical protein
MSAQPSRKPVGVYLADVTITSDGVSAYARQVYLSERVLAEAELIETGERPLLGQVIDRGVVYTTADAASVARLSEYQERFAGGAA